MKWLINWCVVEWCSVWLTDVWLSDEVLECLINWCVGEWWNACSGCSSGDRLLVGCFDGFDNLVHRLIFLPCRVHRKPKNQHHAPPLPEKHHYQPPSPPPSTLHQCPRTMSPRHPRWWQHLNEPQPPRFLQRERRHQHPQGRREWHWNPEKRMSLWWKRTTGVCQRYHINSINRHPRISAALQSRKAPHPWCGAYLNTVRTPLSRTLKGIEKYLDSGGSR